MRLFIASPLEGLEVSQALRDELLDQAVPGDPGRHLRDVLEIEVWNGAFLAGNTFLEDLERASAEADFAVFVCDTIGRGNRGPDRSFEITSANVLFEYGLFLGRLGWRRCFLLVPHGRDVYLPTDAEGITRLGFRHVPDRADYRRLRAELHPAAALIAKRIAELGDNHTKLLFQRLDTFTQVIAQGLDDLYEIRKDALEPILRRISASGKSLELHTRVYLSELIRERKRLADAVLDAVENGARAGVTEPYTIRFVAVDPDDESTVAQLWRIEDPDDGNLRWPGGPAEYREKHLGDRVPQAYRELWNTLRPRIRARARRRGLVGRKLEVRRAYYRGYLPPYCVVLVDREVLWVGLYTFTRVFGTNSNFGTFSPTMKLVDLEPGRTSWFDRFLEEIERVDRNEVAPESESVIEEFDV